MSMLATTDALFFEQFDLDRRQVEGLVDESLGNADDGELFLEYRQSESFAFDDGKLRSANYDTEHGFGLRAICGEATGFAHSSDMSQAAIRRAGQAVRAVRNGYQGSMMPSPPGTNHALYADLNPLVDVPFATKVKLLEDIDAYIRGKDTRVRQVSVSLTGSWQAVQIIRVDGQRGGDIRPLVRLSVSVVVGAGDRMESGSAGCGGRTAYTQWIDPTQWRVQADEALRQALVNLQAVPAPAGEMTVILGPGWPGVMLHEAVGHGLEGDFNRKKTSAFAGLMGQKVASSGVTVIDDGTLQERRGSLSVDDEGTPTERTVLIENGILTGFMQDRQNAKLMGTVSTGNGRRQSHAHAPMPRMTNTFMLAGGQDPAEIIGSVERGLYAVNFGGGQVDITSGKFVFSCTEAYLVEGGKIGPAVKGATLIGNGPDALTRVSMIGNDLALDSGIGVCGKDGQGVPVGVGQPTMRIDGLTVGGTTT